MENAFLDMRIQVLADGVFHLLMYVIAVWGLYLMWNDRDELAWKGNGYQLLAHAFIGFGSWHLHHGWSCLALNTGHTPDSQGRRKTSFMGLILAFFFRRRICGNRMACSPLPRSAVWQLPPRRHRYVASGDFFVGSCG